MTLITGLLIPFIGTTIRFRNGISNEKQNEQKNRKVTTWICGRSNDSSISVVIVNTIY